uniref:RRM domain-containing protein n=1 Tax=Araucaria cunninghamii TaxID=56994 RepID=A0A0D6R398_ARACU
MDSDQGKLFIGGISWETTEDRLKDYFKSFGEVVEAVIMKDRTTGRARGFGFVVFADPAVADRVVLDKHIIDGRTVEAKKAVPRDDQHNINRANNTGHGPLNQARTKKIFVGGLASTVTESDFRKYFEQFGTITDVVVMYDHGTQRPRGFGFITYDSEDAVEKVLIKTFHDLNGKMVEVKKAVPKELSPSPARTPAGGFGLGGNRGNNFTIGYGQAYSPSPVGGYGVRMDNRYGPNSGTRGGYPAYGAAGYGIGATFGPGINQGYSGGGFGSNFNYGASPGVNYGGASSGYGGPAGYGGSSAGNGAYANSLTGGRNMWSQAGLSYSSPVSSAGYIGGGSGNMAGYASGTGVWGTSTSGSGHAAGSSSGLSSASFGYGSVENGYGPSALSAGSYAGRSTSYGVGTVPYGSSTGGYGGAYSDMYGSSGYGDTTWRSRTNESAGGALAGYGLGGMVSDGPSNVSASYTGGYGDAGRQTHRGVAA